MPRNFVFFAPYMILSHCTYLPSSVATPADSPHTVYTNALFASYVPFLSYPSRVHLADSEADPRLNARTLGGFGEHSVSVNLSMSTVNSPPRFPGSSGGGPGSPQVSVRPASLSISRVCFLILMRHRAARDPDSDVQGRVAVGQRGHEVSVFLPAYRARRANVRSCRSYSFAKAL